MNSDLVFVLAIGIGIVAGLRSLTAPAAVSWAAHLGHLKLQGTPFGFMGSSIAMAAWSVLALAEYVGDLLPNTPARTTPGPLLARILLGGLSGGCLCLSAGRSFVVGALLGGLGGIMGAFAGYQARTGLVRGLNARDAFIAIPEDLVAIAFAYLLVFVASPQ